MFWMIFIFTTCAIFEAKVLVINKKWILGSTWAYSGIQEGQNGEIRGFQAHKKIIKESWHRHKMHEIFCLWNEHY